MAAKKTTTGAKTATAMATAMATKGKSATKPHAESLHAVNVGGVLAKKRVKKTKTRAVPEIEIRASKDGQSNVLYIGHLPHGFFEKQMREFFSQFGTVTNVRLSRSKKTAKSKGYAFLQFQSVEVASIAAEAMDGYHMFGQKLVVKALNKADVHPEIFNGANRVFKRIPWREIEAKRHNKDLNPEEERKRSSRSRRAAKKRLERIAAAGIDYVFDPEEANGSSEAKNAPKTTKATKTKKVAGATKAAKAVKTPATKKAPRVKPASEKKTTPAVTRSRAAAKN